MRNNTVRFLPTRRDRAVVKVSVDGERGGRKGGSPGLAAGLDQAGQQPAFARGHGGNQVLGRVRFF